MDVIALAHHTTPKRIIICKRARPNLNTRRWSAKGTRPEVTFVPENPRWTCGSMAAVCRGSRKKDKEKRYLSMAEPAEDNPSEFVKTRKEIPLKRKIELNRKETKSVKVKILEQSIHPFFRVSCLTHLLVRRVHIMRKVVVALNKRSKTENSKPTKGRRSNAKGDKAVVAQSSWRLKKGIVRSSGRCRGRLKKGKLVVETLLVRPGRHQRHAMIVSRKQPEVY